MRRRWHRIRLGAVLSHVYIWICLIVFVTPFLVLVGYSLSTPGGTSAVDNFQYVMGSFVENLGWSLQISVLTLVVNVLIALPAAYALVRFPVPGKKVMLTAITLPLYVPGAVIGLSLLLTYYFTYHLTTSMWGLVFAMVIATFPLMLTPIVVALKDLPIVFEEAAECLGATTAARPICRIVFPLIGPGHQRRSAARLHHRLQRVPGDPVRRTRPASSRLRCASSTSSGPPVCCRRRRRWR